ncbi:MAG: molybdopterin-dependent oxidoreductase [bacterium]|nr:molybdopterin-dependent oxidoreductase [bacterium]
MKVSRKTFLQMGGTAVAASTVGCKYFKALESLDEATDPIITSVRSTCSPNCTGACGYNAQVSDGRIVTLIQAADYPDEEYNPRGCLKGLSMQNLIYGPDRLKKPLIRTGERGEGKFKAVSWDEALEYTAEKLTGIMKKYGPESVAMSIQVPGTGYVHKGAFIRLASMFGWSVLHGYTMNGDLPAFYSQTFGVQTEEAESIEWANSKYMLIFGSNISVTRLPDAKFMSLAQERGCKVVMVDPNYTPTASKSDEWVPINPSTDAALAMGMANVIINKKQYDEEYIKTFTDLPILVRTDNNKRLLAKDIGLGQGVIPKYRESFVVFDNKSKRFKRLNPEDLKRNFDPSLEGEYTVTIRGKAVKVKPAFQLLKELVNAEYTPEKAAKIITPPGSSTKKFAALIERLAGEISGVTPLHIIYGASNYQWYHGDLKGRAMALLAALTGNIGKSGGGISTYAGQFKIRWPLAKWWLYKGKNDAKRRKTKWVTFLLWFNEKYRKGEEFKKYNKETPYPKNGVKAFVFGWNNPFDQHNMSNKLRDMATSNDLELIVASDFQMTTSCTWADVVLPGVAWYEKYELVATILHTYIQTQQPAIKPLFDSMPELWTVKELAKKLTEKWDDPKLKESIAEFYPNPEVYHQEEKARKDGTWTLELARKLTNQASLDAIELMLKTGGPLVKGITLEQVLKGPVKINLPTPGKRQIAFWEQINEHIPFPPQSFPVPVPKTARFVKSGRMEFYKDEDVFIDFKETLPVHKDPFMETEYGNDISKKDKYKFAFITRNSLYRVHSTHSNNLTMLELQEYKAKVFMNPDVAKKKGIEKGDKVKVYNDRGELLAYAAFDPGLHPGVVIFEQGWWSKYIDKTSYNTLTFPWIKPTHLAYFVPGIWEPTTAWNETACDVIKI